MRMVSEDILFESSKKTKRGGKKIFDKVAQKLN